MGEQLQSPRDVQTIILDQPFRHIVDALQILTERLHGVIRLLDHEEKRMMEQIEMRNHRVNALHDMLKALAAPTKLHTPAQVRHIANLIQKRLVTLDEDKAEVAALVNRTVRQANGNIAMARLAMFKSNTSAFQNRHQIKNAADLIEEQFRAASPEVSRNQKTLQRELRFAANAAMQSVMKNGNQRRAKTGQENYRPSQRMRSCAHSARP